MTDDASTAYICIYCPFNSDNFEALENHLTSAHGYGCQDAPLPQSTSSSNIITKTNKREAPDDEQSQTSFDGTTQIGEHSSSVKRIKRTPSALSTNLYINSSDNNSEFESDVDDDDERDSSLNLTTISPQTILTCPICDSTYHRLGHLIRHAKRKHRIDLSNYDQTHSFDTFSSNTIEKINSNEHIDKINSTEQQPGILSSSSISETNTNSTATTTDCPYCDFKTTDIEQFKAHIIAHIRDKNYRCLLCNRLYKYRGDCSFHIRRKHHKYSSNSNDYIQRFLFDTTDGDESLSTQAGGHGSSGNGTGNNTHSAREQDEPVRYFGCPYCDYTSNYGGDVRKHQTRKHPNAESKVVKIIRQDSEQQNQNGFEEDDEDDSSQNINLTNKIKSIKKTEKTLPQQHSSSSASLPVLSNFAPVRVFQCSSCHQQGTYKWVVERHIRAKHPDQANVHVIELPAELSVRLQKITPPLKRFRCSLCPLQSKHSWVVIRHIKHFHTLQTANVIDIQPDGKPINEEAIAFPTNDFSTKSFNHDSEASSTSSSCVENAMDFSQQQQQQQQQQDNEEDNIQPLSATNNNDSMSFVYKCSLCDYQSTISWSIQKHINEKHAEQSNAYMLTQCRQTKLSSNDNNNIQKLNSIKKSKHKNGLNRSLSPTSALAKAKFSPAVEEALLSLQGSKLNPSLYAVQPKFGIKRLKCRHCFYRSNWKTDMIRHVRIRHNLTEPDHNKDMIMMTEQEARSTIELYENTFGKELRRRTFRTWNDWAKAEQEFTPKDGSLQYADTNEGQLLLPPPPSSNDQHKSISKKFNEHKSSNKSNIKIESQQDSQPIIKTLLYNKSSTSTKKDELKQVSNPSNIVSRLLLTTSPSHNDNDDDDIPLDLSLKPTTNIKTNNYQFLSSKETLPQNINDNVDDDDGDGDDDNEEVFDESSPVNYLCSVCPYKCSNWSLVQRHISLHLTGQGITCPICSYTTSSHNPMFRHMTNIHPTSQIPIHFQLSSKNSTAHIIEQHQCSLCSYQCDRSEALNLHRRLEHDDEEFDIDSSDGEDDIIASTTKNIFDCPVCSPSSNTNNFTNLEELTMHVITNHNNQSCPFCSFIAHTTSSQTLIQHIKLHFNGTLVQPDSVVGIEQVKELLMLE
ncbi:unnamed protein product [Adineta steineri]|uniref:C2H2-type domain-containing protein n=1 Tax=Adineta steineri TaxID=433720 RepID=A0A814V892_9BILA|nr:unnamed protein product [Adineta steineri]